MQHPLFATKTRAGTQRNIRFKAESRTCYERKVERLQMGFVAPEVRRPEATIRARRARKANKGVSKTIQKARGISAVRNLQRIACRINPKADNRMEYVLLVSFLLPCPKDIIIASTFCFRFKLWPDYQP